MTGPFPGPGPSNRGRYPKGSFLERLVSGPCLPWQQMEVDGADVTWLFPWWPNRELTIKCEDLA